jgi:hypothetical protein
MERSIPRHHSMWTIALGCSLLAALIAGNVRAGIVAHWSFDKVDRDGTYPDSAGNAHPATPVDKSAVRVYSGSPPAPFGKAVTLLGPSSPDSYLTIPPMTNIQKTSLTVAVWVNLTSPVTNFVLTDWPPSRIAAPSFAFGFHPFGEDKSTAQPSANLESAEGRRSVIKQELRNKFVPLEEWHHFAWVWDRENEALTSYLDGEALEETKRTPSTGFSHTRDVVESNRRIRIGSQETTVPGGGGAPANLTGALDELWIFDQALTPLHIRNLIRTNNIHNASLANVPFAESGEATDGMTPEAGADAIDEPPSAVPDAEPLGAPNSSAGSTVANVSDRRTSSHAVAIVTCLTVIVTASCYLIWAFRARARLRAAGKLP